MAAVTWASAVILFRKSGESVHPIALNLFKILLAIVLIIPVMLLTGVSFVQPVSTKEFLLLLLSGVLGIGLADSMFFKSLNLLGAGLSAIVDCLYSPFIIGLSMLWLGESLGGWQILGVLLILSGVLTVTRERNNSSVSRRDLLWGILWGVGAMGFMAVGIVMIKPLLERTSLLWTMGVRLAGGSFVLTIILMLYPARRQVIASLLNIKSWKYTIPGSFTGSFLAMMMWLGGMKYIDASKAAALNQTSNIFIFIFAWLFLREPITLIRLIGIVLAVGGAFVVMFG